MKSRRTRLSIENQNKAAPRGALLAEILFNGPPNGPSQSEMDRTTARATQGRQDVDIRMPTDTLASFAKTAMCVDH